jgi:hypothetical protein
LSRRFPASIGVLTVTAVASLASVPLTAQAPTTKTTAVAKTWTPPRTVDGQPDLQGIWNSGTATPLERPRELEGKAFFTEQEAAEYEKQYIERSNTDRPLKEGDTGTYNEFWWEHGTKVQADRRTSLVVDPPNGRVPPLTPEAQKRADAVAAARPLRQALQAAPNTWEDLTLRDRCIQYRPQPQLPTQNNNNYQIVQGPGYVAIVQEEIHETRIIPLDGRPHLSQSLRQWEGDPRGHWEGNTLVVDTTNFTDKGGFGGSKANLHLVERYTRVDPDTIEFRFTVEDPTTWTRPWTAAVTWRKGVGLYEYACHEGNYAAKHSLSGARAQEKAAEAAGKQ